MLFSCGQSPYIQRMLWIIFALLVGIAALTALWPLSRTPLLKSDADRLVYEASVLAIAADVSRGLLSKAEADYAKATAARAFLSKSAIADTVPSGTASGLLRKKMMSVFIVLVFPFASFGLYSKLGAGDVTSMAAVSPGAETQMDLPAALKKIEDHLREHPEDGAGYEVIAPVYTRLGRFSDAASAYLAANRLLGETPERLANYAEALILIQNGKVTDDAEKALKAAVLAEPFHPKANFYLGLEAEQAGDKPKAKSIWTSLLQNSPADAAWRADVEAHLAAIDGDPANQPTSASNAIPQADAPMIRGMVEGLAAKLEQNPNQLEGWLRLIRSYVVLKDIDKAKITLEKAKAHFASDATASLQIQQLALSLGLTP